MGRKEGPRGDMYCSTPCVVEGTRRHCFSMQVQTRPSTSARR
jgi:hypothetical protein